MREIKFRAWDKINHKTRTVTRLTFGLPATGHAVFLCHLDDGTENPITLNCEDNGDATLLQYTGLHDKNGKEIYEGDIVKIPKFLNGDWQFILAKVVYQIPSFRVDYGQDSSLHSSCEVIGNIYENPELLTSNLITTVD